MFKEDHSVGERGAAGRRVQVKPAFCACLRGRERRGRGSNVRRTRPCTGRPALCELNVSRQRGRGFSARTPRPVPPPRGRWSLHRAAGASIGPQAFFHLRGRFCLPVSTRDTRVRPGRTVRGPAGGFQRTSFVSKYRLLFHSEVKTNYFKCFETTLRHECYLR